jgi:chemotaxis protein CheC
MNLTQEQLDNLQEVINIGVGEAAAVLNEMLNAHIELQIPFLQTFTPSLAKEELEHKLGHGNFSAVELTFQGSLAGNAELVFPTDSAAELVALVTEQDLEGDDPDLDLLKIGALTEIGNIVISGVMGAISNLLAQDLHYMLPAYLEGDIENLLKNQKLDEKCDLVMAQTRFFIQETKIQGDILLIFQVGSFSTLLTALEKLAEE